MRHDAEVLLCGNGLIGSVAAAALGQDAVRTIHFSPPRRVSVPNRWMAINLSTQNFLTRYRIQSALHDVTPLRGLRVFSDHGLHAFSFHADMIQEKTLGCIVDAEEIISAAQNVVRHHAAVETVQETPTLLPLNNSQTGCDGVSCTGSSGLYRAGLCIGADGANSPVRSWMGSQWQGSRSVQDAISTCAVTQHPHQQMGWQVFVPTGTVAFLPLMDAHHVAVIWSCRTHEAQALMRMDLKQFERNLNQVFGFALGSVQVVSDRISYPISTQRAVPCAHASAVLVGDAAHVIPPLAGQGANLGFSDLHGVLTLLIQARTQGVSPQSLLRYHQKKRSVEHIGMCWAMNALHRVFSETKWSTRAFQAAQRMPSWMKKWMMHCASWGI